MSKFLESKAEYELFLPELRERGLPSLLLPKKHYSQHEIERGKRAVIELDEFQVQRLLADENAMSMFKPRGAKLKIDYVWLDSMPQHMRTNSDIINSLEKENAQLRQKVRNMEAATQPAALSIELNPDPTKFEASSV